MLFEGGKWQDKGLIFSVKNLFPWAASHAYVPTALVINDKKIRVFVAFWDVEQRGRLGYVDVDPVDLKVIGVSTTPVLSDSAPGSFDADGVTPLSFVRWDGEIRLYYAGWRRLEGQDTRYTLFTGLAVSEDGTNFSRFKSEPVIGPGTDDSTVRTGGFVMRDEGKWRCWFADFVKNITINGKTTPSYRLATMTSPDGIIWPDTSAEVFPVIPDQIFGYGRSAIWKDGNYYQGLFSVRRNETGYSSIEYAQSRDGVEWMPFDPDKSFHSDQTIDGQSEVSFPSIVRQADRTLMFYNGDGFGRDGLRVAVWS